MQNRVYNTKAVVEAGLITALLIIMMLINIYVPFVSIIVSFALPIPITLLYIRHNYKVTLISIVVSGIIVSMIYNPLFAFISAISIGITGIVMGYCVRKKIKSSIAIILLAVSFLITNVINLFVSSYIIYKGGLVALISKNMEIIHKSMDSTMKMYGKLGVSEKQLEPLTKALEIFTPEFILMILPGALIAGAFVIAYISYNVTEIVLRKLKYDVEEMTPFSNIYINSRIGVFIVSFLLIGAIISRFNNNIASYFINSSVIFMQLAFALDGIALAVYYMKNKFNLSKGVRILIIVLTIFSPLANFYAMAGLADLIIDFRKLDPYRKIKAK